MQLKDYQVYCATFEPCEVQGSTAGYRAVIHAQDLDIVTYGVSFENTVKMARSAVVDMAHAMSYDELIPSGCPAPANSLCTGSPDDPDNDDLLKSVQMDLPRIIRSRGARTGAMNRSSSNSVHAGQSRLTRLTDCDSAAEHALGSANAIAARSVPDNSTLSITVKTQAPENSSGSLSLFANYSSSQTAAASCGNSLRPPAANCGTSLPPVAHLACSSCDAATTGQHDNPSSKPSTANTNAVLSSGARLTGLSGRCDAVFGQAHSDDMAAADASHDRASSHGSSDSLISQPDALTQLSTFKSSDIQSTELAEPRYVKKKKPGSGKRHCLDVQFELPGQTAVKFIIANHMCRHGLNFNKVASLAGCQREDIEHQLDFYSDTCVFDLKLIIATLGITISGFRV